ncbi:MAG: tetratricopeptide repeat protein [Flavobacteriales bacterium]
MSKDVNKSGDAGVNLEELYSGTEVFLEKNRKTITMVLIAVVGVFIGYFGFVHFVSEPKENAAALAVIQADLFADIDSVERAVLGNGEFVGYEEIATVHAGTKVAKRAHFWCGVYYRDIKKDYQTALDHFNEADFSDEAMSVMVTGCIGDMYVELGNLDEGASWLEKAARSAMSSGSKDYSAPFFNLKAAKVYMELGKNDKAIGLLKSTADNFDSSSPEFAESEKLLAYLTAKE